MKYICIVLIAILFEFISALCRVYRRKHEYLKAKQLSKKLKKPLLVIGDPDNGGFNTIFNRVYGCGDICIDIVGCNNCKKTIKDDALKILKTLPSNSYVIFESCVLEYISYDTNLIIKEIKRVSGGDYFNVRVGASFMYLYYFPSLWTNETSKQKYVKYY